MLRSPIEKTLLSTSNTRAQSCLGSPNVKESVAQQNISVDSTNSTVVNASQMTTAKNIEKASENGTSDVKCNKRDSDSDPLSNRDFFGSMVSINEDFNPDADAATTFKKIE